MKKILVVLLLFVSLFGFCSCKDSSLPLPEVEEGMRGELGIDKNINESTIDKYLNRSDAVYRDMRMLKDEANYEAIGGDSYLSGFVKGFEVVPYPYLCNVVGLPEAVGSSYSGNTLFTVNEDGSYTANYEESMEIIETYFPKDKTIFLMCGGGGYAGMTKNLLVALGYDGNKIYNTGGYWYYNGENRVDVKREENGETFYDFHKVNYHDIFFDTLHPANGYVPKENGSEKGADILTDDLLVDILPEELKKMEESKQTFILYVYLPGCTSCASFKPLVDEFCEGNKEQTIYKINYQLLNDSDNSIKERIDSTPSIFIYVDGEIKEFLNPASNDDLPYYKTTEALSNWINNYIKVNIIKSSTTNDITDCVDNGCKIG